METIKSAILAALATLSLIPVTGWSVEHKNGRSWTIDFTGPTCSRNEEMRNIYTAARAFEEVGMEAFVIGSTLYIRVATSL